MASLKSMLTYNDMHELLSRVTWYPGTVLSLHIDRLEGIYLIVEWTVPNSSKPDEMIDLRIVTWVPPLKDNVDFMDWLLYRLNRIAVHESTEWLKQDGVRWVNPHELER